MREASRAKGENDRREERGRPFATYPARKRIGENSREEDVDKKTKIERQRGREGGEDEMWKSECEVEGVWKSGCAGTFQRVPEWKGAGSEERIPDKHLMGEMLCDYVAVPGREKMGWGEGGWREKKELNAEQGQQPE